MSELLDVLLADHWLLERLLDRVEAEDDAAGLPRLLADLAHVFAGHEALERDKVAPTLGVHQEDGDDLRRQLDALTDLDPSSRAYRKQVVALAAGIRAHLRTEEELVFPLLRAPGELTP